MIKFYLMLGLIAAAINAVFISSADDYETSDTAFHDLLIASALYVAGGIFSLLFVIKAHGKEMKTKFQDAVKAVEDYTS